MWTDKHRQKSTDLKKKEALERYENGKYKHLANGALKKILITSGKKYKCDDCGINEWKGKKLSLQLEHIDGDSFNGSIENLKFLCPNCHSITDTYCGKNKNTGKKKVSDEMLLTSLKENSNIRQALIAVGLSPRGGNYARATKLNACVGKLVNPSDLKSDASACRFESDRRHQFNNGELNEEETP